MKDKKRPKLPRGLRWHSQSQYIWFIWYDAQGRQHKKSAETTDPAKALLSKVRFLEQQEARGESEIEPPDLTNQPLARVAELYFEWKLADNSPATVARERRMFNNVLKFFGPQIPVKYIRLPKIRQYQIQRRKQISPTMKQPVTARSVNYEMQLLRGVMTYADCWTEHLAARYKPLRAVKSRAGKIGSKEQLIKLIRTARANENWKVVIWCGAVAAGTGCRGWEVRNLQLKDISSLKGKIRIIRENAKSRKERQPLLMQLAEWGLQQLLLRAQGLGATEPDHYLLPLNVAKSRHLCKQRTGDWDVNRPMTSWVHGWRKLTQACGMKGFRFHDLRHTFRTHGAEAGVPMEVMMAQLGHMDRETSLDYVHIQQRALERAKQLIELEQAEIFAATQEKLPPKRPGGLAASVLTPAADHHSPVVPEPTPHPQTEEQETTPEESLLASQFSGAITGRKL